MTARYYLTAAIEYANGAAHLGHALEKVGADAIARFHRLRGADVRFLIGTDEHGLKVAQSAAAAGVTPQQYVDRVSATFRATWDQLGISYTTFSRTTSSLHREGVLALIQRILANDPEAFEERAYRGSYCVGCEAYKTAADLVDGGCPLHPHRPITEVAETNWFFRLSRYEPVVRRLLTERPEFVQPASRRHEILALLDRGLDDVSITRAHLDWGIPFPLPSADGTHQRIYVWFDALPNYLTATGFPHEGWETRWPAQCHIVGKDISRFHAVLWPAVLHAAGLPLPDQIWVHGFVTTGGTRLSNSATTDGGVTLPAAIERFGVDAVRYYLLRDVPFDGDGECSWERLEVRYVADLANTLGNLASRVTALASRAYGATGLPTVADDALLVSAPAQALREAEARGRAAYVAAFAANRPHLALRALWETLSAANLFVTQTTPWALAKDPLQREAFDQTLGVVLRVLAQCTVLLSPALPETASRLWEALGAPGDVRDQRLTDVADLTLAGWQVRPLPPLFPRAPAPS